MARRGGHPGARPPGAGPFGGVVDGPALLAERRQRLGMLSGVAAYSLWGIFPLVFRLVDDVVPLEILAHRIVWSFVVVVLVLATQGRLIEFREVVTDPASLRILAVAAVLISLNWLTYIWAVNNEHVLDAALGYYINPLISVALGVFVLGESLRRGQRLALTFGTAAVVVLTVANGELPWISLVLACSFGGYGYMKKWADVAALPSLAVETALLFPLATAGLLLFAGRDELSFLNGSVGRDAILVSLGVVTAVPLLLFATAATRIPLSMVGLLQYLTPTMQMLCGLLLLGESLPPERLIGFALVWCALTVLGVDAVGHERRRRAAAF